MEGHQWDSEDKKRAQNRQAQRLYRQRMKEKVRMLQAKVDAFELHANTQQLSPVQSQPSQSPNVDISESDLESLDHILGYHAASSTHHLSPEIAWQAGDKGASETQRYSFAECSEYTNVTGNAPMGSRPGSSSAGLSGANHASLQSPNYNRHVPIHSTQEPERQHTTDGISSSRTLSAVLGASLHPGSRAISVEDRVSQIVAQVRAAGYCDLDSAWHEYYTAALPTGSALSIEQRLSRNRRLPGVIASLSRSAQSWSAWERTGLEEQLVHSAEAVLINECRSFRHSVNYRRCQQACVDGEEFEDDALSIFQEQLPNLTALITCLTSNDSVRSPAKAKRLMAAICFDGI
ncbi:hypothetical protein AC578_135 [Pseudocercospora eumusae]|uniref:BZIP domain-containing protein n=1 Tax=Pseudocercospora eumusae TaxID=321146 RepID=A0A139GXU4_9PEZI|nr:hypothetical protein AC578_135 [Pseudocercospora eumusae]